MRLVLQSQAAECSLACLVMVADHHGMRLDLDEVRRRFATSLKGSNMSTLAQQATSMGMQPRALQLELGELGELKRPCVLHWGMNPDFPLGAPAVLRGRCRPIWGHFRPSSLQIAKLFDSSVGSKLPPNWVRHRSAP